MQINHVRPVRRRTVAIALLLGLVAAAAIAPAASAATGTESVPSAKTVVTSRVVVERSGGLTGHETTFVVDATNPSPDAPRLFALTAGPDFLALDPVYLPPITCCDFFAYQVTVTYTVGSTKVVKTMDGATAPAVLWDVILLTQLIGGPIAAA